MAMLHSGYLPGTNIFSTLHRLHLSLGPRQLSKLLVTVIEPRAKADTAQSCHWSQSKFRGQKYMGFNPSPHKPSSLFCNKLLDKFYCLHIKRLRQQPKKGYMKTVEERIPIYQDWTSHSGVHENSNLLECNPISMGKWLPTFRRR
jgi:hypothetical protein